MSRVAEKEKVTAGAQLRRSDINQAIGIAREVFSHFQIPLPGWAQWNCEAWDQVTGDPAFDEVRDCMLGWDVTDFGSMDFYVTGRTLFTVRNGKCGSSHYVKPFAEKILLDPELQRAPAHFHRSKFEDIICLAGGNMLVQLEKADETGQRSGQSMEVSVDGVRRTLAAGAIVRLRPGESVSIPPRTIHQFWAEEGTGWQLDGVGYTVSREISSVCDDWNDNVFLKAGVRFPEVLEDEPRLTYLVHEYPRGQDS